MKSKRPPNALSERRRGLHAVGLGAQALGALVFAASFVGFACAGQRAASGALHEPSNPVAWWFGCLIGGALIAGGGFLRGTAARGIAGSGLVLDPEQARRDLSPWARAGGGLLKDALDEAGRGRPAPEVQVRLRCRACERLNGEDARFCSGCGSEL